VNFGDKVGIFELGSNLERAATAIVLTDIMQYQHIIESNAVMSAPRDCILTVVLPKAYVSACMDQGDPLIQNRDSCFPGAYLTLIYR